VAWPLSSGAQQRVPRVGVLRSGGLPAEISLEALRQGLRELGYIEGQNIVLEIRLAPTQPDRLPELAAELVRLGVDVIVTHGPAVTAAVKQATNTIPIVMGRMDDADAHGFVASLARPGGNITGVSFQSGELATKWFELLKDVLPQDSRIAFLWDANGTANQLRLTEQAARSIGVAFLKLDVRTPGEFSGAIAIARERGAKGIVLLASPMMSANMSRLAELALENRLAAVYLYPMFVRAGGLFSYGPDENDPSFNLKRAAFYVDRILKGAKPAELPVEQPTRFVFGINLKTAKTLGVRIPETMLGRADEVIE
jgi:putative ABC transport system substrate-binding protein